MKKKVILLVTAVAVVVGTALILKECGIKRTEDMVNGIEEEKESDNRKDTDHSGNGIVDSDNSGIENTGNDSGDRNDGESAGLDEGIGVNGDSGADENAGSNGNAGTNGNMNTDKNTSSTGNAGVNENIGSNGNADAAGNTGSNGNTDTNGSISSEEPDPSETAAEKDNNTAVNAGYYVITTASDGGYQVMVHGGEHAKGRQLLTEYLANMGCCAPNGIGGGWINIDRDQFVVYVRAEKIIPIDDSANEW